MKKIKLILTLSLILGSNVLTKKAEANERVVMIQYPTYCLYNAYGQIRCEYISLPATTQFDHYTVTTTYSGEDHEYHCYHIKNSSVVYGYCTKVGHN